MKINLKTKVFKSFAICLTLLLFSSCGSKEQKQFKHTKVETTLTNEKDKSKEKSVENFSTKDNIPIESKIELDKFEKSKLSLSEKKKIAKVESSDSSKSINQNVSEITKSKYSGNPFGGRGGTNSLNEPGRDHGGSSANCYGGKICFYEKDSNSVKRFYISTPNTRNIKNEEFCKISFKVSVDANGNIISACVNSSGTTTTNQELIEQVKTILISELKYNKVDPNTPVFNDYIYITIQPN